MESVVRRALSATAAALGAPAGAGDQYDRDAAGSVRGRPADHTLPPILRPRGRAAANLRHAGALPAPAYRHHRPAAQREDIPAALSQIDHQNTTAAASPWPADRLAEAGRWLP